VRHHGRRVSRKNNKNASVGIITRDPPRQPRTNITECDPAAGAPETPRLRHRLLLSMDGVPVIAGVKPRPAQWRHDQAVLGHRLLHDDNGNAWRRWFTAAGLEGFDRAKHLYFTDYALTIAAALRGQGVALGAAAFIEAELKAGRLAQVGQTRVPFGEYFVLEANVRSTAPIRSAFVSWLESEIRRR
jgi:LysR family transcriptional regulator, glycine cleavage system transcriptional activator